MNDNYQNQTYLTLLDKLGPKQSLILIEKLMIDLKNVRRGLRAAQSAKAVDMLNEPSHVLISLAGVVGVMELHKVAKKINEFKPLYSTDFPDGTVLAAINQLDGLLRFLKSDQSARGNLP
ncbi:MAG: hypothetical protein QM492_01165 [Rhodobacterales bacterium]